MLAYQLMLDSIKSEVKFLYQVVRRYQLTRISNNFCVSTVMICNDSILDDFESLHI
jgi:hypothetical protein